MSKLISSYTPNDIILSRILIAITLTRMRSENRRVHFKQTSTSLLFCDQDKTVRIIRDIIAILFVFTNLIQFKGKQYSNSIDRGYKNIQRQ